MTWLKTGTGHDYLVCPGGFAYLHPWANPSFTCGVVYYRDGRVEVIPHQDHHRPFEGRKYPSSLLRAQAVVESLLGTSRPSEGASLWERLLESD